MKRPVVISYAQQGILGSLLADQTKPVHGCNLPCSGADTELFYSESSTDIAAAKSFCSTCPLKAQCAAWALQYEEFGIFGGLTRKERQLMRGSKRVVDPVSLPELQKEFNFILQATSATVASFYAVETRTVVRWRAVLAPYKKAA